MPPLSAPRPARRGGSRFTGAAPARLLAAVVLLASGGAGLAYSENPGKVLDAMGRAGGFEVRMVHLDGHHHTSGSAIVAAVGLGPHVSILTLDVEAVRARVEELPWVTEATVRKVFPRALEVAVVEAEPVARWRSEGVEVLVAADGSVLADQVPNRFRSLPLVAGRGANEAVGEVLSFFESHPAIADVVAAAVRVNDRRWDLLLAGGATVRLPESGAAAALDRFAWLDREVGVLSAGAVVVDVRLPERTTVELAPSDGGAVPVAEDSDPMDGRPVFQDPLARTIAEVGL